MAKNLKTMRENATIVHDGDAIILPKNMKEAEAIEVLKRRMAELEQDVQVREMIPGYPLDALLSLQKAMKEKYGWTSLEPDQSFFGEIPPMMVGVTVDATGTVVQVPWGKMGIPGVAGYIQPGIQLDKTGQPQLLVQGVVKRRDLPEIADITARARKVAKNSSIYRGKAIRVSFPDFRQEKFDPQVHVPQFLRLEGVSRNDLIYRREVDWAVQTSIFTPIENLEKLREMGTPFRRGILAAGEYGVGKTLLANVTAKICEQNKITFIYLEKTGDIAQARAFASMYAPAVIFAEDVDSVLAGEGRSEDVNSILNTIDGVEGKHDEVMIIFSTNHPEKINRALLRPGRLDAVITIEAPDAEASERLVRMYAKNTLSPDADLREVGQKLAGSIPAAIREVVERAKLAAVPRSQGGKVTISAVDLLNAADSMKAHLDMLKEKPVSPPGDFEKLGYVLGGQIRAAITTHKPTNKALNDAFAATQNGVRAEA